MFKSNLMIYCVSFVCIAGLASCRHEKQIDSYKPEPVALRHTHSLRVSGQTFSDLAVDVQDVIDPTAAKPSRVTIETHCKSPTRIYKASSHWSAEPVSVMDVLPTELRPFGPSQLENLNCNFAVTLENGEGSAYHDLHLSNKSVVDRQEHLIHLEESPSTYNSDRFIFWDQRREAKLFWIHEAESSVYFACEDFQSAPINPAQIFSLGEVSETNIKSDEIKAKLLLNPRQSCRVFSRRNQRYTALSDPFDVAFEPNRLIVRILHVANNAGALVNLDRGVPQVVFDLEVHNPEPVQRILRVPIQPTQVLLEMNGVLAASLIFSKNSPALANFRGERAWGNFVPTNIDGTSLIQIKSDDKYRYFKMPPMDKTLIRFTIARSTAAPLSETCRADSAKIEIFEMHLAAALPVDLAVKSSSGEFTPLDVPDDLKAYFSGADDSAVTNLITKVFEANDGPILPMRGCPE